MVPGIYCHATVVSGTSAFLVVPDIRHWRLTRNEGEAKISDSRALHAIPVRVCCAIESRSIQCVDWPDIDCVPGEVAHLVRNEILGQNPDRKRQRQAVAV